MAKEGSYIDIKDVESIKRALENAEIEYEEFDSGGGETTIELDANGIKFFFDSSQNMVGIKP